MFAAITKTVLPPDYDNNPTQLNYGVAVTDVDGDGDLEMFVAGWEKDEQTKQDIFCLFMFLLYFCSKSKKQRIIWA